MNCSMPGLPVHHQLLEFTQTNVHWVSDAIQPSHPLSFPPPAFNLSQHQGLFKWVSPLHQAAKVLEFRLQHQSFQWTPMIFQWSPLGWTGWISLQSKGLSRAFSNTTVQKHQFFFAQLSLYPTLTPYMTTGKTIALTRWTFVGKVMSLLFNMLSRLVITFLPRIKHLLISWLLSPSAVILEPPKIKSATLSPSICHEVMGLDAMNLVFFVLSFKPTFSFSSFTLIKRLFSSSLSDITFCIKTCLWLCCQCPHDFKCPSSLSVALSFSLLNTANSLSPWSLSHSSSHIT